MLWLKKYRKLFFEKTYFKVQSGTNGLTLLDFAHDSHDSLMVVFLISAYSFSLKYWIRVKISFNILIPNINNVVGSRSKYVCGLKLESKFQYLKNPTFSLLNRIVSLLFSFPATDCWTQWTVLMNVQPYLGKCEKKLELRTAS